MRKLLLAVVCGSLLLGIGRASSGRMLLRCKSAGASCQSLDEAVCRGTRRPAAVF